MGTQQRASYEYEVGGRLIVVDLSVFAMERLNGEAMRGLGLVPRRGAEVGGILLGRVAPGPPVAITVEDFEAVPCDYSEGPVYLLNGVDRQRFAQRLAELNAARDPNRTPVGYYRSHTADPLAFSAEDARLMDEFFPGELELALIVRPSALTPSTAALFFRENGVFESNPTAPPFQLARREAGGAEETDRRRARRHDAPAPQPVPGEASHYETNPVLPAAPAAAPGRLNRRAAWAALLTALVLFLLAGAYRMTRAGSQPQMVAPEDPYMLGLRVERAGSGVLVSWNHLAPPVRSAWRAVLTVSDGDAKRTVELDATQARSGNVLYRHVAPELRLRLEVFVTEQRSVVETLEWRQPSS